MHIHVTGSSLASRISLHHYCITFNISYWGPSQFRYNSYEKLFVYALVCENVCESPLISIVGLYTATVVLTHAWVRHFLLTRLNCIHNVYFLVIVADLQLRKLFRMNSVVVRDKNRFLWYYAYLSWQNMNAFVLHHSCIVFLYFNILDTYTMYVVISHEKLLSDSGKLGDCCSPQNIFVNTRSALETVSPCLLPSDTSLFFMCWTQGRRHDRTMMNLKIKTKSEYLSVCQRGWLRCFYWGVARM